MQNNFIAELEQESKTTRKVFERIPKEKFDWRPHEKSMTMGRLAVHIAEMIGWIREVLEKEEFDLNARDYEPFTPKTNSELMEFFDKNLKDAIEVLSKVSTEEMAKPWTLRRGEKVVFSMPRAQVLRSVVFNHVIHHRGQLSVYLRLNDIPVPSIYGPSADET
ncbi:MAG: DinB family protein [Pyrinomonadaceae bacterium]|nr:DinB family protein [Pyrinomonadaceae bacterium]MCX7639760.1 DinB family protein [Pyrinomonadaceae bacterium]MDW8304343.1 DinB family protein [Acidobacteriota bacterium]